MKETPRKHETEALAKKEAEKADQSGESLTEIARPSVKEMLATLVQAFRSSPALLMTVLGGVAFHFVLARFLTLCEASGNQAVLSVDPKSLDEGISTILANTATPYSILRLRS